MVSEFPETMLWRRLRMTLDMIKFEHSVFALPFALTGASLALREHPLPPSSWMAKIGLILLAMVSARSAAMAFNRLLDARIDAKNPRTSMRHLPSGLLTPGFARVFVVVSCLLFVVAAGLLNRLCLLLAPVALAIVLGYSYTKRFTSLSHLVLGFALGIAPAAAWIAVTGSLDLRILWLTAAVALWTGGFDIIYACQDYEFDRREGMFSVPSRFGVPAALKVARLCHIAMVGCLCALYASFGLGSLSALGIATVGALLIYEHSLVKPSDLTRVNAAFFTVNGYVSVLFFLFWAADIFLPRSSR